MISLPKPHSPGQRLLIESNTMDVCMAGRRFGKTEAGTQRIYRGVCQKPGLYWWVGLSWRAASMQVAWRTIQARHRQILTACGLDYRDWRTMINKELRFPNDAIIQMRTAENPESLAGEAVDGFIFDEFTMARETVWTEHLAPTLITTDGWGLFIGVPKGNNWGTKLWRYSKGTEGWNQFHFTTLDNPLISQDKYDEIAASMPDLMVRQELLAEVVSSGGHVFKNVTEACSALWQDEPTKGRTYMAGIDWGRSNDYTVVTVIDVNSRELVFYDRFTGLDFPEQLQRIQALHEKWRFARIIGENNSLGGPMVSMLASAGVPVQPFETTNDSKREIIELLALSIETQRIGLPLDEILIDELMSIEMTTTELGKPKYAAPKGCHDDLTMSLALAHWGFAYRPSI